MNLSANTKASVTFGVIGFLLAAGYGAGRVLDTKADQAGLDATNEKVATHHTELQLLKKDIEFIKETSKDILGKLDYLIKDRRREREGLPPSATPAPSPNTLSNPIGR